MLAHEGVQQWFAHGGVFGSVEGALRMQSLDPQQLLFQIGIERRWLVNLDTHRVIGENVQATLAAARAITALVDGVAGPNQCTQPTR